MTRHLFSTRERFMTERSISYVEAVHASCLQLSEAQRLALATMLVRDTTEADCVLQLRCIADAAHATRHELERNAQFADALA